MTAGSAALTAASNMDSSRSFGVTTGSIVAGWPGAIFAFHQGSSFVAELTAEFNRGCGAASKRLQPIA
jgi:ABC-type uncharacterized transport system permease subunit